MVFRLAAIAAKLELFNRHLKQRSSGLFEKGADDMRVLEPDRAHLAILQMGVAVWNRWRVQDPLTKPMLANADLTGFNLENVNLCQANLSGANLSHCYSYDADFQSANLGKANFSRAWLIGASFHKADLSGANLSLAYLAQSDLSQANLYSACLKEADLHSALLTEATLTNASLAKAVMTDCLDLTLAQLRTARDAHLALCSDSLSEQLDLIPGAIALHPTPPTASEKTDSMPLTGSSLDSPRLVGTHA